MVNVYDLIYDKFNEGCYIDKEIMIRELKIIISNMEMDLSLLDKPIYTKNDM